MNLFVRTPHELFDMNQKAQTPSRHIEPYYKSLHKQIAKNMIGARLNSQSQRNRISKESRIDYFIMKKNLIIGNDMIK